MSDRVFIFDTTLRDGEQSCGCSMTVAEKMRMARKLVELNVDVMEAGFPMASEGDFEAVDRIGQEFPGHRGRPGPLSRRRHRARGQGAGEGQAAPHPHLHRHQPSHLRHKLRKTKSRRWRSPSSRRLARQYVDEVEFSAEDATRTSAEILIASPSRGRSGRPYREPARHGRIFDSGRIRATGRPSGAGPGRTSGGQRPLPQ